MRVPLFKRIVITLLNIFFPPIAVLLITGPNADLLFNCLFFLLAVIPSHIHAFYISLTYFNRKRKVRNGVYPGRPRSMIFSERVNNGGASRKEVERLRRAQEDASLTKRLSRIVTGGRQDHRWVEDWDDGYKEYAVSPVSSSVSSPRGSRRHGRRRDRDDYD